MKKVYVNEQWCLGCHLCEYYCAFANSGKSSMIKALKDRHIAPRIRIEERNNISFAVSCRHCTDPLCVKSCISGALSIVDGAVMVDSSKSVCCFAFIIPFPYGALSRSDAVEIENDELCKKNEFGMPLCVQGCPNKAIVYEER